MHNKTTHSLAFLGFTPEEQAALIVDAARHAAYQLAAQECGRPMAELAATKTVVELIGSQRWNTLAMSAPESLRGTTINAAIDEQGPVITLDEMSRLGALVLGQFLANEGR